MHVLKTILIPVVTVIGLELGSMIAFAVVTETVFAWPGMGKLLIESIYRLDRPVIVAYLMVDRRDVRGDQLRRRRHLHAARSARAPLRTGGVSVAVLDDIRIDGADAWQARWGAHR